MPVNGQQDGTPDESRLDRLYDQAVDHISRQKRVTFTSIQRHLTVGYNTAARIMERLEIGGIVGPHPEVDYSREMLITREQGPRILCQNHCWPVAFVIGSRHSWASALPRQTNPMWCGSVPTYRLKEERWPVPHRHASSLKCSRWKS